MNPSDSLLDKEAHGTGTGGVPPPTSLLSRAMAARKPLHEPSAEGGTVSASEMPEAAIPGADFDTAGFEDLVRDISALSPNPDSILELWTLVSESIPLAAIAMFLPRADFLVPAAENGFPSGKDDSIPITLASHAGRGPELLDNEAKALIAPILGVSISLSLRASTMSGDSGVRGMWVYHDPVLEAAKAETLARLDNLLARCAEGLPIPSMVESSDDPGQALLTAARKYASASVLSFDLRSFGVCDEVRFRGLKPDALRSSFLAACDTILSRGGSAIAFGDHSVGCLLGSTSTMDPDLALFQFRKTLRRLLPHLAAACFPEGRVLIIDPSSANAFGDLSTFLSE
jgi:hypothetical protein